MRANKREAALIAGYIREAVDRLSMLGDPGFPMPASASVVKHITDKMLAGIPKEREATAIIVQFLGAAQ